MLLAGVFVNFTSITRKDITNGQWSMRNGVWGTIIVQDIQLCRSRLQPIHCTKVGAYCLSRC